MNQSTKGECICIEKFTGTACNKCKIGYNGDLCNDCDNNYHYIDLQNVCKGKPDFCFHLFIGPEIWFEGCNPFANSFYKCY